MYIIYYCGKKEKKNIMKVSEDKVKLTNSNRECSIMPITKYTFNLLHKY